MWWCWWGSLYSVFVDVKSRFRAIAVPLLALLLTGAVTERATRAVWRDVRATQPALNLTDAESALGQGLTIGLLGGFRAIIADFLWLRMNLAWEETDLPATQTLISLTQTMDPRPLYFWINGARIVAYDMPVWRIQAAGRDRVVPAAVQRRYFEEQAEIGLGMLEDALGFHPNDPLLLIEMAKIRHWKLQDLAGAAALYRRAVETGRAPYYAARIYAELLKQMGRADEAYAWLIALHPTLPADDPNALSELVLDRIRELETRLGIPDEEAYQPESDSPRR